MEKLNNIIMLGDSYKISHHSQYPKNTTKVFSYFESRGGRFSSTVFFGLQYILKKYLVGKVITREKIDEAEDYCNKHLGKGLFNKEGWEYILEKHEGRLPIKIMAVPEGLTVPVSNVLMTVENTDPECYWLTNYLETLLVQIWYPTTVATLSRSIYRLILEYLEKTGDPSLISFKLHDFGCRGVSSMESAGIGGVAHLVNFMGTDTLPALVYAREYYGEDMAGFSIPAAEHSTITSWGRENEVKAFENMLDTYPTGFVAVVSDSFNIYEACEKLWGEQLKDKILNRDGCLVVRPDSGDPTNTVLKILNILGQKFGYQTNSKGYRVLNPKIRIIQGDGVDHDAIGSILQTMAINCWSADNIAFGMGGALLQKLNRDTQKFAFKCSMVGIKDKELNVSKNPVDSPWKASKEGKLLLTWNDQKSEYETISMFDLHSKYPLCPIPEFIEPILKEVFIDGKLLVDHLFGDIRVRANEGVRQSKRRNK